MRPRTLRLAADAVAAVLALNLWLSLVLLPALFVAGPGGPGGRTRAYAALAALPLFVFGIGIARRSPLWMLLIYPATLLLPVALDPRTAAESTQSPFAFFLVAASLVGYLFGSAYLTRREAPPTPSKTRRMGSSLDAKRPERWRRRSRIYHALGIISIVFPAALLYKVDFAPETRAYLAELYRGGRATAMLALMNLGALAVWLAVLAVGVIGPLAHHRTGDSALVKALDRLRLETRRPTPRLRLYVGVVVALALMGVLLATRGQRGEP